MGIINTPFAVILSSLVSPLGVYLMRVCSEQAEPNELVDAARVDGGRKRRTFRSVAFPVLAPGFVTRTPAVFRRRLEPLLLSRSPC